MSVHESDGVPEDVPKGVIDLDAVRSVRDRSTARRVAHEGASPASVSEIDDHVERRIAATLATLRSDRPLVPNDMVDDVLAHVFEVVEHDDRSRRTRIKIFLTAGGIAAVCAGAFVGAVALERQTHVLSRGARMLAASGRVSHVGLARYTQARN